jgi:hypothetical protein
MRLSKSDHVSSPLSPFPARANEPPARTVRVGAGPCEARTAGRIGALKAAICSDLMII